MNIKTKLPPKKYFKLWWKYLRRSKNYKEVCLWLRKRRDNPSLKFPDKFVIDRARKKPMPIYYTLMRNNDIHSFSFEEWYEYKKERFKASIEWQKTRPVCKCNKYIKADLAKTISELKKILNREPTLDEIQAHYDKDDFNRSVYVFYPYHPMAMQAVKETIDNMGSDHHYRQKPIRYYEIERYLQVYDLIESGKKMKEVISVVSSNQTGNPNDVMRAFRRDLAKAKKIIKNVEGNEFPGSY